VKVLVTGANGLIGFAICVALRRNGHTVYGLTRGEEKAKQLIAEEIRPVIGDIDNIATYSKIVDEVSIVIDNVMTQSLAASNEKVLSEVIRASKGGYKKTYIYTSGGLVYGDRPNTEIVDEWTSLKPGNFSVWRKDFEDKLRAITEIETVIVRPVFVYGKKAGAWNWFSSFEPNGEIHVRGRPEKYWNWVHVDDLADAYVRIVESGLTFHGHIYNVGEDNRYTFAQIREAFAKAAGAKGPVVVKPIPDDDFYSKLFDVSVIISSKRIATELGWKPKHTGPLDDLDVYYAASKA